MRRVQSRREFTTKRDLRNQIRTLKSRLCALIHFILKGVGHLWRDNFCHPQLTDKGLSKEQHRARLIRNILGYEELQVGLDWLYSPKRTEAGTTSARERGGDGMWEDERDGPDKSHKTGHRCPPRPRLVALYSANIVTALLRADAYGKPKESHQPRPGM